MAGSQYHITVSQARNLKIPVHVALRRHRRIGVRSEMDDGARHGTTPGENPARDSRFCFQPNLH